MNQWLTSRLTNHPEATGSIRRMIDDAGDAAGNVINVDGKRCGRLKKS